MLNKSELYGVETPFLFDTAILAKLEEQDCRSIFDIIAKTKGQFVSEFSDFDKEQTRKIYDFAMSRVQTLTSLYRAMQSRNEPLMQSLPKMGVSPQPEALSAALRSALNGAPDFGGLFPERSTDGYALAGSVQSLFSPGRYLVELYKIAQGLHTDLSPLQIDNRRPDIGTLILNEQSMYVEMPTLLLVDAILKKGIDTRSISRSSTLEDSYYPMTLPYDDNLAQIRSSCAALKTSLQTIWSRLGDDQWSLVQPISYVPPIAAGNDTTPSPYSREQLKLTPNAYKFLTSPPSNEATVKSHYNLTAEESLLDLKALPLFTERTQLTFNQLIDMTAQYSYQAETSSQLLVSRYYSYPQSVPSTVTVYGQTYLSNASNTPTPMLVQPIPETDLYELNFLAPTVLSLADRAERLLRLQRKTGLEYALLDWLIKNINTTIGRTSTGGGWKLDTPVLNAIAEFSRLANKYSISANTFSCFIGTMNTYAKLYEKSMFEDLFTSPTTGVTAPLNAVVNFTPTVSDPNAILICGGLGISANDLYTMAQLAFNTITPTAISMDESKYAQLYRLAIIPRMLGMSFPEARVLWQVLDPEHDMATVIARSPTLQTLDIIKQTEAALVWMDEHQLDIVMMAAMTAKVYSTEPTPEVFNFLSNIYATLSSDPSAISYQSGDPLTPAMSETLYRIIAGTFQVKANVMSQLISWLDLHFKSAAVGSSPYGLGDFWAETYQFFSTEVPPDLQQLVLTPNLVRYSNALGQFTLIAQWGDLTEQDLTLLVATPDWFFDDSVIAPPPSVPVLMMLSRLKEWQQRVTTTEAEALSYFNSANQSTQTAGDALALLAYIQGWELGTTQEMNNYLIEDEIYTDFPKTFQQLNRLETWMKTSQYLSVGSSCINDIYTMSLSDPSSEASIVTLPVAEGLTASIQNSTDKDAIATVLEDRRDAWVEQYIAFNVPKVPANGVSGVPLSDEIKTPDDLSEYLLIDTKISAKVNTTLIAEAISSLQLYINRCLGGYDPAVDNAPDSTMVDESRPGGFLYDWDDYNQMYSTWSGKERLQYYSSTYITPSLRYNKTTLFIALEQNINQGRITTNRVIDAFTEYLIGFETLANLKTISAYQAGLHAREHCNDMVYFVGKTKDEPYQYYYRRANLAVRSDPLPDDPLGSAGPLTAGSWSEWVKISAPAENNAKTHVSPFWFQSRLYVCWLEEELVESDSGSSSKVEYSASIYYQNSDGEWTSFRKISIPSYIENPQRISGVYNTSTNNYVLLVEAGSVSVQKLYAYIKDGFWEVAGNQWAPSDFVYLDTDYPFGAHQVKVGDTFIVGNDLCEIVEVNTNDFKVRSRLSTLTYTKHTKQDAIIGTPSQIGASDGILTLTFDSNTAYITIANSNPSSLKLYVVSYTYEGFASIYFDAAHFSFDNEVFNYYGPFSARISTSSGPYFYETLQNKGVEGLLSYATQVADIETPLMRPINFNSAYGIYFWEIFFYIAFQIADRYLIEQNYDQSAAWYKYIFSCTGYRNSEGELETITEGSKQVIRYWNVVPLQTDTSWNGSSTPSVDPDVIAMNDPMQFKMAIFLKTVDLLIKTGDHHYRQLERDMLAKAKMYYIEASQLLGPRPVFNLNNSWPDRTTVADEASSIIVMDNDNPISTSPTYLTQAFRSYLLSINGNFLPPYNEDLLKFWDTVELRLYNLRHDLSITGQPLSLPVYATPVSPEELQQRHSAGNGAGGNSVHSRAFESEFRFVVLLEKARTAVNSVIQFGAELLSTLEKSDNERMTLLLQVQQQQIIGMTRNIQSCFLDVQKDSLTALQAALEGAQHRLGHYGALYDEWISPSEDTAMNLLTWSGAKQTMSLACWTTASVLDVLPNIYGLAMGGGQKGAIARAVGFGFQTESQVLQTTSTRMTISEQYRRRRQDWEIQRDNAVSEVRQLEAQIQAQTQQIAMAEKQLLLNEQEQANQKAIYNLQITRFTGEALYNWMVGRLSALYYQLYDVTLPLCLTAKKALGREIGDDKTTTLFTAPMWNDLYQGLLAGEGLLLELTRMERAYLQYDIRGLEVQKTVSLDTLIINTSGRTFSTVVADALQSGAVETVGAIKMQYISTTDMLTITLEISSLHLGTIYNNSPLTSKGRFKTISVTLPTLLGPYQDVEATLQMGETLIALSRGLDDSGMFILDYNDPQYLPFEGAPITEGELALTIYQAKGQQAAVVDNLVDVIYQLRYTLKPTV